MFSSEFDLSNLLSANGGDGTEGLIINGVAVNDNTGIAVSSAGDLNNDGIDDLLIGGSGSANFPGESYIIFGQNNWLPELNLSNLVSGESSAGLVLQGLDNGDFSGYAVSGIGDFNDDGIDDIVIGARSADGRDNNSLSSGETYVIYGSNTLSESINLADIVSGDGSQGLVIYGISNGDTFGDRVSSAGDINGDDINDLIISAKFADHDGQNDLGASYIIFGSNNLGSQIDLTHLINGDGSQGLVVYGIDDYDFSGTSISGAGDVNGDGFDDLIFSANQGSGKNNQTPYSGESYVIYGSNDLGATVNLTNIIGGDGSQGFAIYGVEQFDFSGLSVSGAGDVNGDSFDDLIIGAELASGKNNQNTYSGESYVVYGSNSLGAEVNLADIASGDGSNGLVLYGVEQYDYSGTSVSSGGDFNGDGIDDLIIGASRSSGKNNQRSNAGESYVVFGHHALGAELNLADLARGDGSNGLVLYGIDAGDLAGTSVSRAGDLNGDGIDDIVIGANNADGDNNLTEDAGETYVVFGKASPDNISDSNAIGNNDLSGSDMSDRLDGGAGNDIARGGDGDDAVDGDNGQDRLYGDQGADHLDGGKNNDFIQGGDDGDRILGGAGTDILLGNGGNDTIFGNSEPDILNGGAGVDILDGGTGRDRLIGGTDRDIFVLRGGDLENIIYDFVDNSDVIDLVAGLTFDQLTIVDNGFNTGTNIIETSSGDLLVSLIDVDETDITLVDFL